VVLFVLLATLGLLPFALASLTADMVEQSERVVVLDPLAPGDGEAGVRADIHVQVTALNEWDGSATVRVSLHQSCGRACPWGDRVLLVSLYGDTAGDQAHRPGSATVTLPAGQRDVTQAVQLPVYGDPVRYPFDRYRLGLGVVVERVAADGTVEALEPERARAYAGVTFQARIPRAVMRGPALLDPAGPRAAGDGDAEPYLVVAALVFERPFYLKALTLLLVLLVAAAAAYAVFLRPLDQLIINAGALVLGVWGVRAILLGVGLPGVTAVDVSLIIVTLALLVAITVRTLYLLEDRSRLRLLRRRAAAPPRSLAPTPTDLIPPPGSP